MKMSFYDLVRPFTVVLLASILMCVTLAMAVPLCIGSVIGMVVSAALAVYAPYKLGRYFEAKHANGFGPSDGVDVDILFHQAEFAKEMTRIVFEEEDKAYDDGRTETAEAGNKTAS